MFTLGAFVSKQTKVLGCIVYIHLRERMCQNLVPTVTMAMLRISVSSLGDTGFGFRLRRFGDEVGLPVPNQPEPA